MSNLIASDSYNVVLGLGATGLSVARYYAAKKKKFVVIDTRKQPPGLAELNKIDAGISVVCGEITSATEQLLLDADEIVVSPGLDRRSGYIQRAIKNAVSVIGDVELFLREVRVPVVGITGSNGKTTVTTLVTEVAMNAGIKACAAGNIGLPVLDALQLNAELYVLELSSFQLESTSQANLAVACVLNVSEDHMDRYNGFSEYVMAKQRIYHGAKSVVYNLQDKLTQPPIVKGVERRGFALRPCAEQYETQYVFSESSKQLLVEHEILDSITNFKIFGRHNIANILAVFAISDALGIERSNVKKVVANFTGLAHRCEWVTKLADITFINDSKATNVGAAVAAISGLCADFKHIVLVAGGEGKGADFSELGKWINERVAVLVLLGKDKEEIKKHVDTAVSVFTVNSMQEAVLVAYKNAVTGSLVLLSPACASFDMFTGYEDRGSQFVTSVKGLAA
ncbi:UDP-N-acetylmuramoylalanine--D-glutamate ligase [Alteromonadaceae bacterium 2753L.S.0a.02]|nr:UDP-N-acetylmuramoylalanine--D-glutamate ligase [Alteromonadaceae bacterium 2753L.S.0a.02]